MQSITDIIRLASEILVFLGIFIPMVIALVKAGKKAIKEKNWKKLLDIAMSLMSQAEKEFENGTDRKSFVMQMLKTSLEEINYEISDEELSDLIDSLVDLTNKINTKK